MPNSEVLYLWNGNRQKSKVRTASKIPKRWLHIHYYEALNILFRFENSVRVFVYAVLKNEFRERWQDCCIAVVAGEQQSTIKATSARRISQAENFGYLGFDIRAPLMHLTSGELVDLITSEAYWTLFRRYFKGNKDIIKNKLLEIGTIRNSLAHFRPIKGDDIELIKQNVRHTLLEVEKCLDNMFSLSIRVPTNTTDGWYGSIRTLGEHYTAVTPFYSTDESWVNVQLAFTSPILMKREYGEKYVEFDLANVNSPNVMLHHDLLRRYMTYLTESVRYPHLSDDRNLTVTKEINLVFRRDVLATAHVEIGKEIAAVLERIAEECKLLADDKLARGTIVEVTGGWSYWSKSADREQGTWKHDYTKMSKPYLSDHPDEYWGQSLYTSDVVGALQRYPWMPENISEDEFPF